MPIIKLDRTDILQTKLVDEADWYKLRVREVKLEAAKKDQSTNYVFYCNIVGPREKDVPVRVTFSEKFLGAFVPFAKACGCDVGEDGGAFNTDGFVDQEFMSFVEAKENPNDKRIYNTPMQFMSVKDYEEKMASV